MSKPEIFNLPTVGNTRASMVVNKSERTKDFVDLRVGKSVAHVPLSALYKIILSLSDEEAQEALVPTQTIRRRTFRKIVTIEVPTDLPANRLLTFPVDFSIDMPDGASVVSKTT